MKFSLLIFVLLFGNIFALDTKRCEALAKKHCPINFENTNVAHIHTCDTYIQFLRCFDTIDRECYEYFKNRHICRSWMAKLNTGNRVKMIFQSTIFTAVVCILLN
ncbi:uncharacterized protein LOC128249832 [Octopus bimaculoides]|uniref:uncharacterized protein LOC128249832 n=1 Tax=Octopus bimaculoides TaxID=37653 RepID=UPI0022E2DB24|nr:uncharacterized protein LOC128249832 [Octopus bimaculoides]